MSDGHAPSRGRKGLTFRVLVHLDIIEPPPDEYGNVIPRKMDWRFGVIDGEHSTRDRRDPHHPSVGGTGVATTMTAATVVAVAVTRGDGGPGCFRLSATVPPKFFPLNVTMQPRQQDSILYIHSSRNRSPYTFSYISLYSLKNHFHITNFNQLQFSFSLIIFHPSDVLRMYSKIKFIKNNYFTITTTKNI